MSYDDKPWLKELKDIDVRWDIGDFKAHIIRHKDMGHLCGYVGVGVDHPLYGRKTDDDEIIKLDVHGGVTFAGHDKDDKDDGVWWIGFDCAHAFDVIPYMPIMMLQGAKYRDFTYVSGEVEKLARQLQDVVAQTKFLE